MRLVYNSTLVLGHAITMEGYLDLFNVPAEKILQAKHLQSNSSHIGTHITGINFNSVL